MKTIAIIPARYASNRFPGKPLVDIAGKTMIQRVIEQASKARLLQEVFVATDHLGIFQEVERLGYPVFMTSPEHPSGTDRCAEVLEQLLQDYPGIQYVLNVQGDEPFLDPLALDQLIELLQSAAQPAIATLAKPIESPGALQNPNTVKVVLDQAGWALYFSRFGIPYVRAEVAKPDRHLQHIGLYGFQAKTLLELTRLTPTYLEQTESLEQLRWLENGYRIKVGLTEATSFGIDTPEDLQEALKQLKL